MWKVAAAVAAVVAVCVGANVAAPQQQARPAPAALAAPAAAPANPLGVRSYLAAVRALGAGTTIADRTDDELIASGRSLCSDIDNGATAATFSRQVADYGVDAGLFGGLLRVSVLTFCPQHVDVLR